MKYKVSINFYVLSKMKGFIEKMREYGITNDDLAIFDYIYSCCDRRSELSAISMNNQKYYWISHSLIIDALPLLGKMRENKDGKYVWEAWSDSTVLRSINRLCDVGLVLREYEYFKAYKSKNRRKKTFYAIPREIKGLYNKHGK